MKINKTSPPQFFSFPSARFRAERLATRAGLTLVEITVVIAVVISMMGLLFIGAKAWKSGSDRAACVMNIYRMQEAVRSYATIRGYYEGQDVSARNPGESLFDQLVGVGKFVEDTPVCPRDGLYVTNGDVIPAYGELYMTCSLAKTDEHIPNDHHAW